MILYPMPGACSLASHIALVWAEAEFKTRLDLDPGVQRAIRDERSNEFMDQLELPAGAIAAAI